MSLVRRRGEILGEVGVTKILKEKEQLRKKAFLSPLCFYVCLCLVNKIPFAF